MTDTTIGKVQLDLSGYDPSFVYSDGDVEEEILRIVKDGEDLDRIINTTESWPVFYHLSPIRENILQWYPFGEGAKVLEIGAGCGAVTGVLTRKCSQTVALDLSLRRCQINAWRHRECENLRVVVSNFQRFAETSTEKFDYITLIGVFEYAASYLDSAHPCSDMLELANGLLKPGGRILIAIENRFGAKYFAGCAEDHLGTFFSGICGYPQGSKVKTLNYREWIHLLEKNGFRQYQFYYPYPDYKFPIAIYSDERLPQKGELNRNLSNLDRERYSFFDEGRFWDSLDGTDYAKDFANSFLIDVSSKE